MKRKVTELFDEDNALVSTWINTADLCRLMNKTQFNAFVDQIENQFVTCTDTDVGEFLEEFIYALQASNDLDTHQDIQSLIDDYEINEEILLTIGSHINNLAFEMQNV